MKSKTMFRGNETRNLRARKGHVTSVTNQRPEFRKNGFSANQRRAETV